MLCVRTIMVIRRTVLRLVGFPDEYRGQKKNAEINDRLYISGNQMFMLLQGKTFSVGTSIAVT